MWNRKDLKTKAKVILKKEYWKVVLVSLILALITGGLGAGSSYKTDANDYSNKSNYSNGSTVQEDLREASEGMNEVKEQINNSDAGTMALVGAIMVGVFIVVLICIAIGIVISVLIFNPLIVGIRRFFSKEMNESTKIKEIAFAFDNSYKNIIKIMFFKDLYVFLWTLVLIIPGIIKAYEYRMIPYILGENPDITKEEAFARSKEMMSGQKWNAFVLDLSFIGWYILSAFTFFILNIFYVAPYRDLTNAELYNTLSGKNNSMDIVTEIPV